MSDVPNQAILYVFDSLRRDFVGCYEDHVNTPNIERLATDGVIFENASTTGTWTVPVSGSVFSGLYPSAHGSLSFECPINESAPFISDGLEDSVATACFSTTSVVSKQRGFNRGFDEFVQLGGNGAGLTPDIQERLTESLLPWITDHQEDDFLVIVWSFGTHHPYVTPESEWDVEEADQSTLRRLPASETNRVKRFYRSTVEYCDRSFGKLLDHLEELDIYDQLTMILTADHGEVFNEHARLEHAFPLFQSLFGTVLPTDQKRKLGLFDSSAFIGHQGIAPYDELLRVPLIYKPGIRRQDEISASRCSEPVQLVDVAPTLRQAYDVSSRSMQGHDLGAVAKATSEGHEYRFATSQVAGGPLRYRSVANDNYKLIQFELKRINPSSLLDFRVAQSILAKIITPKRVLVDRSIGEQSVENSEIKAELLRELENHLRECRSLSDSSEEGYEGVADNTKQQLEYLGYR